MLLLKQNHLTIYYNLKMGNNYGNIKVVCIASYLTLCCGLHISPLGQIMHSIRLSGTQTHTRSSEGPTRDCCLLRGGRSRWSSEGAEPLVLEGRRSHRHLMGGAAGPPRGAEPLTSAAKQHRSTEEHLSSVALSSTGSQLFPDFHRDTFRLFSKLRRRRFSCN